MCHAAPQQMTSTPAGCLSCRVQMHTVLMAYCNKTKVVFFKAYQNYQTYRAMPPPFLIWNNLCDLVYQRPTGSYRSQTAVT